MDPTKEHLSIPMALENQTREAELGLPENENVLVSAPAAETQVLVGSVNPGLQENLSHLISPSDVKRCQPDCLCNMIPLVANHQPSARLDVEEIYQVLGRDILRSSLLEDIDLYLECDEDSVYAVPIKQSPKLIQDALGQSLALCRSIVPATSPTYVDNKDRRHNCPHCDHSFTRANLVKDHRSKVHGESNLFPCPLCSYQGKTSRHFKKHLARAHRGKINVSRTEKLLTKHHRCISSDLVTTHLLESHAKTQNHADSVPCTQGHDELDLKCQKFNSLGTNLISCVTDTGQLPVVPPTAPSTPDQEVIIEGKNEVVQTIPIPGTDCYIIARIVSNLDRQPQLESESISVGDTTITLSTKDNKKPSFSCDACPYKCETSRLLKKHQNAIHNADREVHCCDKCGCTFKQKRSLDSHMKGHLGQFDFHCEACQKKFASRDHLRLHGRTHIQTREFKCSYPDCNWAFRTRGHLRQHERTVHAGRVFQCPAEGCDKVFTVRHLAAAHYKVHTGAFRCLQASCGRTFRDAHNLRAHQRTHPGHNTTGQ